MSIWLGLARLVVALEPTFCVLLSSRNLHDNTSASRYSPRAFLVPSSSLIHSFQPCLIALPVSWRPRLRVYALMLFRLAFSHVVFIAMASVSVASLFHAPFAMWSRSRSVSEWTKCEKAIAQVCERRTALEFCCGGRAITCKACGQASN